MPNTGEITTSLLYAINQLQDNPWAFIGPIVGFLLGLFIMIAKTAANEAVKNCIVRGRRKADLKAIYSSKARLILREMAATTGRLRRTGTGEPSDLMRFTLEIGGKNKNLDVSDNDLRLLVRNGLLESPTHERRANFTYALTPKGYELGNDMLVLFGRPD